MHNFTAEKKARRTKEKSKKGTLACLRRRSTTRKTSSRIARGDAATLEGSRTTEARCAATWLLQEWDKQFTLQSTSQRPPSLLLEVLLFSSAVVTLRSPVRGALHLCWRRDWWMAIAVRKLGVIFICASINKSLASRIADDIHGEAWREKHADLLHSSGQQTIYIIRQLFSLLLKASKIDKLLYSAHLHVHVKEGRDAAFFFPEVSKAISWFPGSILSPKGQTFEQVRYLGTTASSTACGVWDEHGESLQQWDPLIRLPCNSAIRVLQSSGSSLNSFRKDCIFSFLLPVNSLALKLHFYSREVLVRRVQFFPDNQEAGCLNQGLFSMFYSSFL